MTKRYSMKWNEWVRSGDYYAKFSQFMTTMGANHFRFMKSPYISVEYHYLSIKVVPLKSIQLYYCPAGLRICLILSPKFVGIVLGSANKYFNKVDNHPVLGSISTYLGDNRYERYSTNVTITIDKDFIRNFPAFLDDNPEINEQITEKLKTEIKNIITYTKTQRRGLRHIIPVEHEHTIKEKLNPKYENSQELVEYLYNLRGTVDRNHYLIFHKLLAEGRNPNASIKRPGTVKNDFNCLRLIMVTITGEYLIAFLKLAIIYGADPFALNPFDRASAIEYALVKNNTMVLNLFTMLTMQSKKELKNPPKLLTADTHATKKFVVSVFRFPQLEIFVKFKCSMDLTAEEVSGLKSIFDKRLKNDKARDSIFLPVENRFVEIITNAGGEIVGCVVHHIGTNNGALWCNIDLVIIDDNYGKYGLTQAIIYRFPFALQLLFPTTMIWCAFISGNPAVFGQIQQELSVPLYQSEGQVEEVASILEKLFGYKIKLHHKDISQCYVEEEDPVVTIAAHKRNLLGALEEIFEGYKLNDDAATTSELAKRNVMMALPVSSNFLKTLQELLARLGLNFFHTVFDFKTKLISSGMFAAPQSNIPPRFYKAAFIFWLSTLIAADPETINELAENPEHKTTRARY